MHMLYTFLYILTLPVILLMLGYKALKRPSYRHNIKERLGIYSFQCQSSIWVHAVSVGETIAAVPIITHLKTQYPDKEIIVTTMTPTGAERVNTLLGDKARHAYLPYDLPFFMQRFLNAANPSICIVMETEWWPNMIRLCTKNNIPICLMNARLSEKSARGYGMIAWFIKSLLPQFTLIAAQSQADAARLIALGASKKTTHVTGSIKFDSTLPPDLHDQCKTLRHQLGKNRFIWIAASTHEGEEEMILSAHARILMQNKDALLMLVPRHPERFSSVIKRCETQFKTATHREKNANETTEVYVGNTMGDLLLFYAAADVALVAGSLLPIGGHNLLEPAALGKPILSGPHLHNFQEISHLLLDADALTIVTNEKQLADEVMTLMQHQELRDARGARALDVVEDNRGALKKQLTLLLSVIEG